MKEQREKEVIIKADRALLVQMIIGANNRKLKTNDALCHPLGSLGPLLRLMDR